MGIASSVCLQLIAKQAKALATVLGSEAEEATEGILHVHMYARLNLMFSHCSNSTADLREI